MQISGITKTTLVDYPGKVACTVFTLGCNLQCRFCHNAEFVLPNKVAQKKQDLIEVDSLFWFLDQRKGLLDGVVLCWWEPTLYSDILEVAGKIKEKWFSVKLDTNGTNPDILKLLIENGLIDYVAMDIKDKQESLEYLLQVNNFDFEKYNQSMALLLQNKIDYEFRTTLIKWYHTLQDIKKISDEISWAKRYCLKTYRVGSNLDPNFCWASFTEEELQEFVQSVKDKFKNCYYVR